MGEGQKHKNKNDSWSKLFINLRLKYNDALCIYFYKDNYHFCFSCYALTQMKESPRSKN